MIPDTITIPARRTTARALVAAGAFLLLACAGAAAQACAALAPDPEQFRQTMYDNATREAELRARLRKPVRIDYAIGLLRDYTGLVTRALTVIDDMETRANTAQERRCPGWEQ